MHIPGGIRYEEFKPNPLLNTTADEQALQYVLSVNLARRHIPESDRLKVALKVRKELQKLKPADKPEGKVDAAAAKAAGVSERNVSRAARVEREGPEELKKAMAEGDVTPRAAEKLLKADKDKIKKAVKEIKENKGSKARAQVLREALKSGVKDLAKRAVPKSLQDIFQAGDDIDTCVQELRRIMKVLKNAGKHVPTVYTQEIIRNLDSVTGTIESNAPAWVCQACQGEGTHEGKKCSVCKARGYVARGNGREPRWS